MHIYNSIYFITKELKIARGHMMPPSLHLSDIRRKYFPYRRCRSKQKAVMNERANESVVAKSTVKRYCI